MTVAKALLVVCAATVSTLAGVAWSQQSEFDRALGITTIPVTNPSVIDIKEWAYDVPLDNCLTLGNAGEFKLEWQLRAEPQNLLEIRFTADSSRGFTGLGFSKGERFQIVSGNPSTDTACARSLYDKASAYDLDGNVFPSYPELPGNELSANTTHAIHYAVRNISVTAARMLQQGGTMTTNVTLLWAYMQSSLFKGSCYLGDVDAVTEMARMQLVLGDATYSASGGTCKQYEGVLERHLGKEKLDSTRNLLGGERHQSTRVAALLFGGDILVRSGKASPKYDLVSGAVSAGENRVGVCQNSLSTLKIFWSGFSDHIGGIVEYQVSAGTLEKPSEFFYRASAQTNEAYTRDGLTLTKNTSIIVTVEGINFAGLITGITSKPLLVLNDGNPMYGTMHPGVFGTFAYSYQRDTTTLRYHWKNWIAEDHSAKDIVSGAVTDNGYEYAIGEVGVAEDNIVGFTTVANFETQRVVSGLSLNHASTYAMTIRAVNCAGAYTKQTSPAITIDTVTPLPGQVYIGNQTHVHKSKIFKAEPFRASWKGFVDQTSGIHHYEWAMSTQVTPPTIVDNTGLIMGWVDVGLLTFARNATLNYLPLQASLVVGTDIYVHVKAVDFAGNFAIANSNATRIVG